MAYVPLNAPRVDTAANSSVDYGGIATGALDEYNRRQKQTDASRQAQAQTAATAAGSVASQEEAQKLREQQGSLASAALGAGMSAAESQAAQLQSEAAKLAMERMRSGDTQANTAAQQAAFIQALQASSAGQGTIAQEQLKQALAASQRATASQIASQRGMNPQMAQRQLINQQAAQQALAAGKAAELGLAEQLQTRYQTQQLMGQTLGQMRQQDIAAAEQQAQAVAGLVGTQRAQDLASMTTSANIMQALQSGDQNALRTAIEAASGMRAADMQAQAQQMGLFSSAGQLDMEKSRQALQAKLAQLDADFKAGVINREAKEKEENYWRDFFTNLTIGAVNGIFGLAATYMTSGANKAAGAVATAASKAADPNAIEATPPTKVLEFANKGGRINGKPLLKGDHPSNDIVPAMLSPGEIVLPRTVAQAEDAPEKAAAFVRALQQAEAKPLSRRAAAQRIAELEAELAAIKAIRAGQERR